MVAFGVVIVAISVLAVCIWRTVSCGRKCAAEGMIRMPQHKRVANHTLLATVFLIFSIETFSYFSIGSMTGTGLFVVHMFFAVPFLLLLITLRFWITGVARRRLHKPLAYTAAGCFLGVLITGSIMLGKIMLA